MTGWNPRDVTIKQDIIDLVNTDFWWHGTFSRNTKTNHAIESLAVEVRRLRERDKDNEENTIFLLKLLDELGKYPVELSSKAAIGNEKETYAAFKEYLTFVLDTANKRLEIFDSKDAHVSIASV